MGKALVARRNALFGEPESIAPGDVVHFTLGEVGVTGDLSDRWVVLHRKACEAFVRLVKAWSDADAWRHVQTFDRSYDPAQVRPGRWGAHAWGNAFDLNTQWNPLCSDGAERGKIGSTYELEEVARRVGWTCGRSFFVGRAARHFEYLREAE